MAVAQSANRAGEVLWLQMTAKRDELPSSKIPKVPSRQE
jgi:hypothetical protein